MPDLTKFVESKYLTADYVIQNNIESGIFLEAGKFENNVEYNREQFVIPVQLNNHEVKLYSINKKSLRALIKSFGADTNKWIGKAFALSLKRKKIYGELTDVVYARPINEEDIL